MNDTNVHKTTEKGLGKLVAELKSREKEIRQKIANTLNEMRNQGDLRENDGYSMAVEEQHINEVRIMELKDMIKGAVIIKDKDKSKVGIGDIVRLKNGKSVEWEVTSEEDANPLEGRISHKSPIGSAVMGRKIGDKVTISTPGGDTVYTIEKIS